MNKLSDLFDVRYGNSLELNRLQTCGPEGVTFVSRKSTNNGVSAYVKPIDGVDPNPAGELTCAMSGNGVLSTFIQERPYYTAFHVACLTPKYDFSKEELLYYCACIKANRYRYNYGRQANRSLRNLILPSREDIPEWVGQIDLNRYDEAPKPVIPANIELFTDTWQAFKIEDLFEIEPIRPVNRNKVSDGTTPLVTSTAKNNGIIAYVDHEPTQPGNVITVSRNGSVGEAFYQANPFCASEDIRVLRPKFPLNSYTALFLTTVIRLERYRFGYGRKFGTKRMLDVSIRLPVDRDGQPDLDFMERYIKSLPYSSQVAL